MIFITIHTLNANKSHPCLFCLDIDNEKLFILSGGLSDVAVRIVCIDCWWTLKRLGYITEES